MEETRGFRFEVVDFGGGEGDWDEEGGDGGLEDDVADAAAAAFAALRAATALSIVEFAGRDDEGMTHENGISTPQQKNCQIELCTVYNFAATLLGRSLSTSSTAVFTITSGFSCCIQ